MKLMRVGEAGFEKPAILDNDGVIRDLSAHVDDINGINQQIASAAEEQIAVSNAINERVKRISQIGEHNSNEAGKIVRHSDDVLNIAGQLNIQVSKFKF